jgi:hypothetical protein
MTIIIHCWRDGDRWTADGGKQGGLIDGCRNAEVAVQVIQRQALERMRRILGDAPLLNRLGAG